MHTAIGNITGRIRLCGEEESLPIEEKEILSHQRHPAWEK
jgi:hypothetical protein